jgi:DNA invertase Pin-like site-specific DNA recombinase
MTKIGYGRVSTRDQHPESQQDTLSASGCEQTFIDHGVSGTKASRPQLDKCLAFLRPGDTLVITRLDRLGRSLANLIALVHDLGERGIDLQVTEQGIDRRRYGRVRARPHERADARGPGRC